MFTRFTRVGAVGCALLVTVLAGCATGPTAPISLVPVPAFADTADGTSGTAEALPEVGDFLAVNDTMRAFVREHLARVPEPRERMRRLARLLLDPANNGIVYDPSVSRGAAELFRERSGNCLSFAALFVALSREARLHAWFQDVPVLPNWRLDGTTFVVERHVNAVVRAGRNEYVIDFKAPAEAVVSHARRIEDRNAAAQFFGNLGVERFSRGDLRGAYALFRRGIEADPGAAALWSNLGVILGRNAQFDDAATAYEQALALEPDNLSALSNLAGIEAVRGNDTREQELRDRVAAYRALNPYYQYWLGEGRLQGRDARGALSAFRGALRLMPDEPDFHFAMARAWHLLGRAEDAERSFALALENAPTDGARLRYEQRYRELRVGTIEE